MTFLTFAFESSRIPRFSFFLDFSSFLFLSFLSSRHAVLFGPVPTSNGRPMDVRPSGVRRTRPSDVHRTSVGRLSDICQTSAGRPSDVHRTSIGRQSDVRRTSDGRPDGLRTKKGRWLSKKCSNKSVPRVSSRTEPSFSHK